MDADCYCDIENCFEMHSKLKSCEIAFAYNSNLILRTLLNVRGTGPESDAVELREI